MNIKYIFFLPILNLAFCSIIYAGQVSSTLVVHDSLKSRQNLYQYCNIAPAEHAPKDVKKLIVQAKLDSDEWLYKAVLNIGNKRELIDKQDDVISKVIFNKQGTHLAVRKNSGKAFIYRLHDKQKHFLRACELDSGIVFNPEGIHILTVPPNDEARLWDLKGNMLCVFDHNDWVFDIDFKSDGTHFATVCRDNSLNIWHIDGTLVRQMELPDEGSSVVWIPKSNYVVTASNEGGAILWDTNGRTNQRFIPAGKLVYRFAVCSQGPLLATVFDGSKVIVWNMSGVHPMKLKEFTCSAEFVTEEINFIASTEFSSDGTKLLLVMDRNIVFTYDLEKDELSYRFEDQIIHLMGSCLKDVLYATSEKNEIFLRKKFAHPTLEQLLLRTVLNDYSKGSAFKPTDLPDTIQSNELLEDVALKLNLDKNELVRVWDTLPRELQHSIIRTMLYRAKKNKQ